MYIYSILHYAIFTPHVVKGGFVRIVPFDSYTYFCVPPVEEFSRCSDWTCLYSQWLFTWCKPGRRERGRLSVNALGWGFPVTKYGEETCIRDVHGRLYFMFTLWVSIAFFVDAIPAGIASIKNATNSQSAKSIYWGALKQGAGDPNVSFNVCPALSNFSCICTVCASSLPQVFDLRVSVYCIKLVCFTRTEAPDTCTVNRFCKKHYISTTTSACKCWGLQKSDTMKPLTALMIACFVLNHLAVHSAFCRSDSCRNHRDKNHYRQPKGWIHSLWRAHLLFLY